ncbi:MAG: thiamine pyrophosphate-dependent dehydrogenase E1 component subunit alpha [Desulfobacterales bacterium]
MKLEKEQLVTFYSLMVRARKLDALLVEALNSGRMAGFYHAGVGEEAVGVGACTFNMREDDYLYPHHRGHAISFYLARGISPKGWVCRHFDKDPGEIEGPTAEERGIFGISGTIGGGFVLSLGWGLTAQKNKKGQAVLSFFGDGASGRGTLHESMNLAAVWKLPIVWICENNQFGQFVPIRDAFAREDIADLAAAYSMPSIVVDGQDVLAVHEAVEAAVDRARAGDGPSLIECKTYRMRAHAEGVPDVDHTKPRTDEDKSDWRKRDPIIIFKEKLIKQGIMTEEAIDEIDREADDEVARLDAFQSQCPQMLPKDASILDDFLYAE